MHRTKTGNADRIFDRGTVRNQQNAVVLAADRIYGNVGAKADA
ncbi:hypothetical protein QBK99_01590 [Corticibacterium sp. UT-5YL-CI-8]|nr:hypothetical protein [Tianweitania sp. UT-5YL-CI-8]